MGPCQTMEGVIAVGPDILVIATKNILPVNTVKLSDTL